MCIPRKDIITCLFVDDMVVLTKTPKRAQTLIKTLRSSCETKIVNDGTPDGERIVNHDILGLETEKR